MGYAFSPIPFDSEVPPAPSGREGHHSGSHFILAKEAVVHVPNQTGYLQTVTPSEHGQPAQERFIHPHPEIQDLGT